MSVSRYLIMLLLLMNCGCGPRIHTTGDIQRCSTKSQAHNQERDEALTCESWNQAAPNIPNIEGSTEFIQQVNKALTLLQNRAPTSFWLVCSYVGIIKESPNSHMDAWTDPPTFHLKKNECDVFGDLVCGLARARRLPFKAVL